MTERRNPVDGLEFARQVARHRGWVLNPDAAFIAPIVEGLAQRSRALGLPYCPCRDPEDAGKDVVCPCRYAPADLEEWGQCYCGLFLTADKRASEVSSIPERRPE